MGLLGRIKDSFKPKEADPELQKLLDVALAANADPAPHLALAAAYVDRFRTPPGWNPEMGRKAAGAYRKAISIAKKQAPGQLATTRDWFVETFLTVARSYYEYHQHTQNTSLLEAAIWLAEEPAQETAEQPQKSEALKETVKDCWVDLAIAKMDEVESKDEIDEAAFSHLNTTCQKAISLGKPDDAVTDALDFDLAVVQIKLGEQFAQKADESAVLGRKDGKLLNVNDREHKDYAQRAIRHLREGRERLASHKSEESFEEIIQELNDTLVAAYGILYNLTLAHSKYSQAMPILEEASEVVPDDADLWNMIGDTTGKLIEEVIDDFNNRPSVNTIVDAADKLRTENKIKNLKKKGLDAYQRAHTLAPDRF